MYIQRVIFKWIAGEVPQHWMIDQTVVNLYPNGLFSTFKVILYFVGGISFVEYKEKDNLDLINLS